MANEKLCVFCKHFDWEAIDYEYFSELTGGTVYGGATCKKDHYTEVRPDDAQEVRALFLLAENCPNYELG